MTWSRRLLLPLLISSVVVGAAACDGNNADAGEGGEGEGEAAEGEGEPAITCTEPTDVVCRDDVFVDLAMSLSETADGVVENAPDGDGFDTFVDARSNGAFNTGPWVYGRFTDAGLEKVELFDDASLDSMDWDIAFQRFQIRLNSGNGGPSCVNAARTGPTTDFDTLAEVPAGLSFNKDIFEVEDGAECTLQTDGSGQGSPGFVMQSWWTYPGCVATTGNVYVVGLADGRRVKLVVVQYYGENQQGCNDETGGFADSALIRFRWAFLE